ncbi:MFS transporter [Chlorogloeopsis sp. ULAP01]|uniref:MFS transporter n=1 Tax=Chlorogloeopsis sp. ULAP01 TaxID=3056483 RepID=UPI0025AB4211|nr:MFS transporter [Chlorogloeopsis sp. ULAP01]MDM9382983.1 MFS transporter [Chlorogloeopsis sp. ULAP01]
MELKNYQPAQRKMILSRLLKWVNLRPEESDRTWLMFAFYTTTSIGLRWSEDSAVALFLDEYGSDLLPLMYAASAFMGGVLVFFYSWLQKIFPLRQVIVAIAPCMFVPLMFLHLGLHISLLSIFIIFILRLWVDAFYIVNDLNTSIAANQLFNIREIKRTYPIISSGVLVADVLSGFSLPFLLLFVDLNNVIMPFAGIFVVLGAGILLYLSKNYSQAFPNVPQRQTKQAQHYKQQRLYGSLKHYTWLLFAFFTLIQAMGVLIDFQYLSQLKSNFQGKDIATFLSLLGGTMGVCELGMQLFISSRALERFGVFITAATLPVTAGIVIPLTLSLLGLLPWSNSHNLLWGLVILKFLDEILRYTFVASSSPLLFQPIPDRFRSSVQSFSGGIADAFGAGIGGVVILITLCLGKLFLPVSAHSTIMVAETMVVAVCCLGVIWLLRSHYVNLLVLSAERGQLNATDIDLRTFKQGVVKALGEKGTEADKRSCIELLSQIDPQSATEVLAPLLVKLPPSLQKPSLEILLTAGANPNYLLEVRALLELPQHLISPEVFALALRYVWFCEPEPDVNLLEQYLTEEQHSIIRATSAALLLRQGTPLQKSTATKILRRMLTHKQERERVNAVRALREAVYLQALRIYIPNLLQDESLGVRCAVLETIAATHLEEYYTALLLGLQYKSTRTTAMRALVGLENEALPILINLATDIYKPEIVRMYAWRTIGQIPTLEAIDTLWQHLELSRGKNRGYILRTLLKRLQQKGVLVLSAREATSFEHHFYENQVKKLIEEELEFLGIIYAAYIDFKIQNKIYAQDIDLKAKETLEVYNSDKKFLVVLSLLQHALLEVEIDVQERLLLLLQLICPIDKIQAAAFNLRSESLVNLARGLEILEHSVSLQSKSVLLNILDQRSPSEKLQHLIDAGITNYEQMMISKRTCFLLTQDNLLSDWCVACCFHFAQVANIRLTSEQVLRSLRHPTGFVREAAVAYLSTVSPRILLKILPQLQKDPHPLVVAQVQELMRNL